MQKAQGIQYSKLGVISLAHMLNDLYSNYLPQLLPFLIVLHQGFTATRAAILVSAFSITSSFAQPFFGYFMDRQSKHWLLYVGTLWMAVMLSLTGIVENYWTIVLLAALAGLGTAAFHPQASTMINVLSGDYKAVLLSAFVGFGNIGFALGTASAGAALSGLWLEGNSRYRHPRNYCRIFALFLFSAQCSIKRDIPGSCRRLGLGKSGATRTFRHHQRHCHSFLVVHRDVDHVAALFSVSTHIQYCSEPVADPHAVYWGCRRFDGRIYLRLLRSKTFDCRIAGPVNAIILCFFLHRRNRQHYFSGTGRSDPVIQLFGNCDCHAGSHSR